MTNQTTKVIEVDARRRVSLGKLATSDLYTATVTGQGTIVLTPVVVIPRAEIEAKAVGADE